MRALRCPDFSPSVCAAIDVPDHVRTSRFAAVQWQGSASIGLGRGFSITASLPLVLKGFDVGHALPDGTPYDVPYDDPSGPPGPAFGLGDASVLLRLTGRVPNTPLLLNAGVGAALPTGATSPDPFDPSVPALQRQPRQFGNGTVDPQLELGLVLGTRPLGLVVQGRTRIPLYANPHRYQGPWTLDGSVGVVASLPEPLRTLQLLLLLDASHAAPAAWAGEPAANSGRDAVSVRLGFEWAATPTFSVRGQLVATPYQALLGEQFAAPLAAAVGISGVVDLRPRSVRDAH